MKETHKFLIIDDAIEFMDHQKGEWIVRLEWGYYVVYNMGK